MKRGDKRVSLWRRGFAFVIDIFIVNLLVSLPFRNKINELVGDMGDKGILETYNYISGISSAELNQLLFIISIISVFATYIYFVALEYKLGQTLGKMIVKIMVKSDEKKLRLRQILIRNITKSLALTNLSLLFLIDLFYVLYSGNKRWTEKWSKTYIEKVNSR